MVDPETVVGPTRAAAILRVRNVFSVMGLPNPVGQGWDEESAQYGPVWRLDEILQLKDENAAQGAAGETDTIAKAADAETWLRIRANAGELIHGETAAGILEIKSGTLRVWAHRGKIAVAQYVADEWTGQQAAWYRLADVIALADAKGVSITD